VDKAVGLASQAAGQLHITTSQGHQPTILF
jgi:hypothetical protein